MEVYADALAVVYQEIQHLIPIHETRESTQNVRSARLLTASECSASRILSARLSARLPIFLSTPGIQALISYIRAISDPPTAMLSRCMQRISLL